jgi:hypothetical protein
MLKRITQNPYLNLVSGFVLLFTAGFEVWESIGEASVGAHHGILVFSLIHIAKSIPEVMHGFKEFEEANEEINDKYERK